MASLGTLLQKIVNKIKTKEIPVKEMDEVWFQQLLKRVEDKKAAEELVPELLPILKRQQHLPSGDTRTWDKPGSLLDDME